MDKTMVEKTFLLSESDRANQGKSKGESQSRSISWSTSIATGTSRTLEGTGGTGHTIEGEPYVEKRRVYFLEGDEIPTGDFQAIVIQRGQSTEESHSKPEGATPRPEEKTEETTEDLGFEFDE